MNALQKTLAIIAFLALASQMVRHAYRLWLEPRGSALDKYEQPLKDDIARATSLEELLARYDKVRKEADEKRKELDKQDTKNRDYARERETEPFKSELALSEAINDWEKKSREVHELRFYWSAGFVFLILGLVAYKKLSRWFGLTLSIVAFSEFIYWTSPAISGSGTREFDRLLANKLAFTVVSLVLLLAVIWLNRIFADKSEAS
ncbi:MAG TPA: hypothetical protein VKL40_04785 [Candidatus Angelobacter sp.]|nr:hypothetical protein [Candidatus Angelobacter sp.]